MNKKLHTAFNDQIKNEFYSAYLYLSMSAYFEAKNLQGMAHWVKVQAKEEISHGMKMFEFLNDRGAKVTLQAFSQPTIDFSSALEVFEKVLEHEKKVTALIEKLCDIADESDDKAASVFLQWFITEQVEEEKNATVIVGNLKLVKPDSAAILMIDRHLGKREG